MKRLKSIRMGFRRSAQNQNRLKIDPEKCQTVYKTEIRASGNPQQQPLVGWYVGRTQSSVYLPRGHDMV